MAGAIASFTRWILSSVLALPNIVDLVASRTAKALWLTSCNAVKRFIALLLLCGVPVAIAAIGLLRTPLREFFERFPIVGRDFLFNPITQFAAAWFAVFISVIINRAWLKNEDQRRLVATEVGRATELRNLPDLRGAASIAALVLVAVTPLVLIDSNNLGCSLQRVGCLFAGTSGTALGGWLMAGVGLFVHAVTFSIIPDVYSPHFLSVSEPIGVQARLTEHLLVATLQVVAITTIWDLAQINSALQAAFKTIGMSATQVAALGPRAIPRLKKVLSQQIGIEQNESEETADPDIVNHAIEAFASIAATPALRALKPIVSNPKLPAKYRTRAARAIVSTIQNYSGDECRTRLLGKRSDQRLLASLRLWAERQIEQEKARRGQDSGDGWVIGQLRHLNEVLAKKS